MISVILYGRNDTYGYNLHKRAALSLNSLGAMLTEAADEIIFVDYNTPNDFPTFPEAIQDTLTVQTKKLLKIIRVRPEVHKNYFAHKTHLKALEPISRNIGIRRSNEKNKWILNTNTDMIFIPKIHKNLTEMVSTLTLRHYAAPRFEIPESIWETFDRIDPQKIFSSLEKLGTDLHLHEVVGGEIHNRYDAPGDFQLVLREDVFKINGFNEEMLIGWHCDSNLNKRLMILNGPIGDAQPLINAYHCDHTREVTPMHSSQAPANDGNKYIYNVTKAIANKQPKWGMPYIDFDEIRISDSQNKFVLESILDGLKDYKKGETYSSYAPESYEKNSFPEAHVLTFLIDPIIILPKSTRISWVGAAGTFQNNFRKILNSQNFNDITKYNLMTSKILSESDVIVINLHKPVRNHESLNFDLISTLLTSLAKFYTNKKRKNIFDTKLFFIDFSHTRHYGTLTTFFDCAKTPYSTRVMIGNPKHLSKGDILRGLLVQISIFTKISILRERLRQWGLANRYKHPFIFFVLRHLNRLLLKIRIL